MAHRNIPVQYPMLTDTNYGVWAVKMKIILRSLRVWQAITDDEVDDECDEGAMATIAQSVPDSVLMTLAEFETAREVWDALKEMRIGEDRITKARAQVLKRQFHKLQMEETESVMTTPCVSPLWLGRFARLVQSSRRSTSWNFFSVR